MFLTIDGLLSPDALAKTHADLVSLRWVDGRNSSGGAAKAVKANRQADLSSRVGVRIRDRLKTAVQSHPVLRAAAQPARFSQLLVSRTGVGGGYGLHYDNPFMGPNELALRTDLSYTLFLSDPEDYDGGALIIERPGETKRFKPGAGSLVLYPSRTLHAVEPVTCGERLACVGWIESRVRSEAQREILFDLENLHASKNGVDGIEAITLGKIIANLKRQFD
ncbi:MAG: Fe2+-dependent dioxygenase [Pseudomonadota bacterium]